MIYNENRQNISFLKGIGKILPFLALFLLLMSCMDNPKTGADEVRSEQKAESMAIEPDSIPERPLPTEKEKSATAHSMEALGLIDIEDSIPDVLVDLMYAKEDNFVGKVLYEDLSEAYLHPEAIKALRKASDALRRERPDLRLKVYDASRPMHIQQVMRDKVAGTSMSKYVSNPKNGGGMHNYGLAVDLTLATVNGDSIPMGTVVDHLGTMANIDKETSLLESGKITQEAFDNRQLLRRVMKEGGWMPLQSEWWHFNLVTRETARRNYKVIP